MDGHLTKGTHSQTSYPRVQQENTLDKRSCTTQGEEQGKEEGREGHGECEDIEQEQEA